MFVAQAEREQGHPDGYADADGGRQRCLEGQVAEQGLVSLRRMELIRAFYAALAPMAPPYFGVGNPRTGRC